ncbi:MULTISPECIES: Mut7-C RNAse domain-containing protein [Paraburkholderia]|uniref:Mut7-C RNAse domain-containing protein n=1 Tax=Paraburkholderia TaxID=1822464 RepID=UPI00224F9EB4|nr:MULTISPECIES: Mut7-C RNAse domain-containing protein [Paraburkholderia]MCX4143477.1 MoaD/ThiS family protein [Paraburkholderia aspalathi]MDN7176150.1 Mut7-C ubiquitin/RNAse domain-containing protein [Paraburkholderia sp. SEWSISQ10-3 4]MDQ6505791.1 Mut7-C ubiquitin/RNAse domain-containing protein [Paraburkholderia aspalathi]
MVTATFRFYEELNDFLARPLRRRTFSCACARGATAKHMIEVLGVPHTEVELILVNGESVGFNHPLADGDRIAVYPKFEALDIQPLLRVREYPLRVVRFIADAHLGGLAPLLRLAGFDTLYDNHYPDADIEALAAAQQRIVLTRDRELLKRRSITHGCYVRTLRPREQLREVFERLDLAGSAQPFRLCLMCNAPLRRIAKDEVGDRAPDGVLERHNQFVTCDVCRRVFWEGTHWQRMRALIDSVAGAPEPPDLSAAQ